MKEYTAEGKIIREPVKVNGDNPNGTVSVGLKAALGGQHRNAKGQGKSSKRALMH